MNSFRKKEFRVGLFLLLVLAAIVAVLIYVGIKKEIFAERITFTVLSTTGENIERGIPVRLSGFKVGQVDEIELSGVDAVHVKIRILERYHKWFREDTRIILDQEGVIGNSYLKVIPGSESAEVLSEGATLPLSKIAGIKELLAELDPVLEDLKVIVANVRGITDQLVDPNGTMQTVLANTEEITRDILKKEGLLYYLTEDPRPVRKFDRILSRTDSLMLSMQGLLTNATARVEDMQPIEKEFLGITKDARELVQEFQGVRKDLNPTLENIQKITEEIRKSTKDLYRLRQKTEYTIRVGTELMQNLRESWPFLRKKLESDKLTYPAP